MPFFINGAPSSESNKIKNHSFTPISIKMFNKRIYLILLSGLKWFAGFLMVPSLALGIGDQDFESWYKSLSTKQKIGQLFVIGLHGKQLSKIESSLVENWKPGGMILFKRNYSDSEQMKLLTQQIKMLSSHNNVAPLIFTDQEGGNVVRIGSKYDVPSAFSLGQLNNQKITKKIGTASGLLLSNIGINVNLAPVSDLRNPSSYNFISNRSFGTSIEKVRNMTHSFSQGLLQTGVLPTLKHFPGLGDVITDSHHKTAKKVGRLEELVKKDWAPYTYMSQRNIPFITMSSHTELVVDGNSWGVTTYSKRAIEKLREITFPNQVVITDDMEMKGADMKISFQRGILKALEAGHDMILIGWSYNKIKRSMVFLESKFHREPAFEERIQESLRRTFELKKRAKLISQTNIPSIPSKRVLNLTKNMNRKIAKYFLEKGLRETSWFEKKPRGSEPLVFFSSDQNFKSSLKKHQAFSLLRSNASTLNKLCITKTCIIHVSGTRTARHLSMMLNQIKVPLLVVNASDPLLVKSQTDVGIKIVNVFTQPKKLGHLVESSLATPKFQAANQY